MEINFTSVDFLFIAGVWAFIAPLLISVLKNIGGEWPAQAKQGVALLMAVLGSFVAVGTSAGWSNVDLSSGLFWQILIIGVAGIFSTQYASYKAIWRTTKLLEVVEQFGVKSD